MEERVRKREREQERNIIESLLVKTNALHFINCK